MVRCLGHEGNKVLCKMEEGDLKKCRDAKFGVLTVILNGNLYLDANFKL